MKQTNILQRFGLALAACGLLTQTASALVTIDSVYVGNAGNAADWTGYGAVAYDYGIGKYEVTLNQYTEFLNAVAKTDTYGLYNTSMGTDLNVAGISRSGISGSYSYSVIGSGNRPVTYVSWYDSARFVNWLHNGQPVGAQAAGTTETGAYTMTGNTGFPTRNSGWKYGLPSENEWYKAAYHQPAAQGGDVDNYWLYPTATNAIPNSRNGSLTDANSANFYRDDGIANGFNDGYAVYTGGNGLADAGAFSLADSFYGTFDQAGNVWE
jgi:formylglycine-generating enzyme required for sulfatase activity